MRSSSCVIFCLTKHGRLPGKQYRLFLLETKTRCKKLCHLNPKVLTDNSRPKKEANFCLNPYWVTYELQIRALETKKSVKRIRVKGIFLQPRVVESCRAAGNGTPTGSATACSSCTRWRTCTPKLVMTISFDSLSPAQNFPTGWNDSPLSLKTNLMRSKKRPSLVNELSCVCCLKATLIICSLSESWI